MMEADALRAGLTQVLMPVFGTVDEEVVAAEEDVVTSEDDRVELEHAPSIRPTPTKTASNLIMLISLGRSAPGASAPRRRGVNRPRRWLGRCGRVGRGPGGSTPPTTGRTGGP